MLNKEKICIAIIFILGFLAFYFAIKSTRKIEVKFSKPVFPVGNFSAPDQQDVWSQKK